MNREFKVIEAIGLGEFNKQLEENAKEGWEPSGYYQANYDMQERNAPFILNKVYSTMLSRSTPRPDFNPIDQSEQH